MPRPFPHIDQQCVAADFSQQLAAYEPVVNHHVSPAEQLQPTDRYQPRIARATTNQVHRS
jgi:hypothetical protein